MPAALHTPSLSAHEATPVGTQLPKLPPAQLPHTVMSKMMRRVAKLDDWQEEPNGKYAYGSTQLKGSGCVEPSPPSLGLRRSVGVLGSPRGKNQTLMPPDAISIA